MSFTQDNPLMSVAEQERKLRPKERTSSLLLPPSASRRSSKKRFSIGSVSSCSSGSSTSSSFSNHLQAFRNTFQYDVNKPHQQQQQQRQQRITDYKNSLKELTQAELNVLYSSDYKFAGEDLIAYLPEKLTSILKEAAYLFNLKPNTAKEFLIKKKIITGLPCEFAEYVYTQSINQSRLSKRRIGEFLGNNSFFNQEVLESFLLKIDFSGMTLDQAIRSLVRHFRLPGEAQQIDRILEKFASVYFKQNNDNGEIGKYNSAIKSASVAYVLSFSILMLNTDLHNPSVARKEKMTLDEFVKNNRGINDGIDVPRQLLEILYLRVKNEEIKMDVADMLESDVSAFIAPRMAGYLLKLYHVAMVPMWKKR